MKNTAQQVHHRDADAFHFTNPNAIARRVRRIVCGTQQARLLFDVVDDFVLVEDVIA